jgi:hypothetical protein
MSRQRIIILRGKIPQLWKSSPRNGREIMMFVMIPNIISHDIPPTIITVSFLILAIPEVMFCDEMTCGGV